MRPTPVRIAAACLSRAVLSWTGALTRLGRSSSLERAERELPKHTGQDECSLPNRRVAGRRLSVWLSRVEGELPTVNPLEHGVRVNDCRWTSESSSPPLPGLDDVVKGS